MSSLKNVRFRTKLFVLFTLFSSIPVLLLGIVAYQKSSVMFHRQTEQDLSVILSQLNTSIDRQIGDFDRFSMLPYYLPDIFSFLNKTDSHSEQVGTARIEAQKNDGENDERVSIDQLFDSGSHDLRNERIDERVSDQRFVQTEPGGRHETRFLVRRRDEKERRLRHHGCREDQSVRREAFFGSHRVAAHYGR
ncbi:hypothetical protein OMP38_05645 [Cohnella ginsengisoli]|uniref:Uncharacterized protein n=1 Tax=Cohnella ginsengisoli TaxID=425004 RepID=A0A9X4QLK5_9BACL|nr:hypothetical protein [Cohnella ginsengisoli]MDG0790386.1 hypothetical protein [Cohnella ginsengisoli]